MFFSAPPGASAFARCSAGRLGRFTTCRKYSHFISRQQILRPRAAVRRCPAPPATATWADLPPLSRPPSPTHYRYQHRYNRFSRLDNVRFLWGVYPGIRWAVYIMGVSGFAFVALNLEKTPVTGRRRFNWVSPDYEEQMGKAEYERIKRIYSNAILPQSDPRTQLVKRVLERLIPASGVDAKWEVFVVKDEMANAFVIPGGKVFVNTGLFPVAKDVDGLATVLGHEIAHNVLHHSAERLSRNSILLLISSTAAVLFDGGYLTSILMNFVLDRPGSRVEEAEADYVGLQIMARSCFDPSAAIALWKRMEEHNKGRTIPQFLSTHPSNHNRMKKMTEWLEEARTWSAESDCWNTGFQANMFMNAVQEKGRFL